MHSGTDSSFNQGYSNNSAFPNSRNTLQIEEQSTIELLTEKKHGLTTTVMLHKWLWKIPAAPWICFARTRQNKVQKRGDKDGEEIGATILDSR